MSSVSPPNPYALSSESATGTGGELKMVPVPLERKSPLRILKNSVMGSGVSKSSLPPAIQLTPNVNHVFRYINTGSSAALVTTGTMLSSFGGICTTVGVNITNWASSGKLHSVTVWPPAGGTAQVFWATSEGREKDELVDRSIPTGVTVTGCLHFLPPAKTLAGFWFNDAAATNLFSIMCSVGSVVDVHVTFRLAATMPTSSSGVSSAVLGQIYYLPLDGDGGVYVPVGLPTTA
jgi:hypothetical protein